MINTLTPAPVQRVAMNPRFVNYARAQGDEPSVRLAKDRRRYPGGMMAGFSAWIGERLQEARREIPDAFCGGRLYDHRAYDVWLDQKVTTMLVTQNATRVGEAA